MIPPPALAITSATHFERAYPMSPAIAASERVRSGTRSGLDQAEATDIEERKVNRDEGVKLRRLMVDWMWCEGGEGEIEIDWPGCVDRGVELGSDTIKLVGGETEVRFG